MLNTQDLIGYPQRIWWSNHTLTTHVTEIRHCRWKTYLPSAQSSVNHLKERDVTQASCCLGELLSGEKVHSFKNKVFLAGIISKMVVIPFFVQEDCESSRSWYCIYGRALSEKATGLRLLKMNWRIQLSAGWNVGWGNNTKQHFLTLSPTVSF